MTNSINSLAVAATSSDSAREAFIHQQEQLILKTASRASYRYITKSDDEWSVALSAFTEAIDKYDLSRGDFIPFSQMLIKRALIDYHRREAPFLTEISTSPFVLEGTEDDEDERNKSVYLAVAEQSKDAADRTLREEILSANEQLKRYGFRFFDLTECSPQQEKTKRECAKAIRYVLADQALVQELEKTRKLPIRKIASSGASKKVLDRYRKYIIMAVIILHGDYPQIAEYLKFVWKEDNS